MYKEYRKIIEKKYAEIKEELRKKESILNVLANSNNLFEKTTLHHLTAILTTDLKKEIQNLRNKLIKLEKCLNSPDVSEIINEELDLDIHDWEYISSTDMETKNEEMIIKDESDLMMVHKTNFLPINGVMYSARDTGAKSIETFTLNGKNHQIEYLVGNDTLHFALNGPVGDHMQGNWNDRKYAVLIPFDEVEKSNLLNCAPEDTYFQGKINLPGSAIILCPKEEKEIVKKNNPNVTVIGYDETISLNQAINCIIRYKKYKVKDISNDKWIRAEEESINFSKIKSNNKMEGRHFDSHNLNQAQLYSLCSKVLSLTKYLTKNQLEETEQLADVINQITMVRGYYNMTKEDVKEYLKLIIISILNDEELVPLVINQKEDFLQLQSELLEFIENQETFTGDKIVRTINYCIVDTLLGYSVIKKIAQEESSPKK